MKNSNGLWLFFKRFKPTYNKVNSSITQACDILISTILKFSITYNFCIPQKTSSISLYYVSYSVHFSSTSSSSVTHAHLFVHFWHYGSQERSRYKNADNATLDLYCNPFYESC